MRVQRDWETQRDELATVRRFNARLLAKGSAWFWRKIAVAHQGRLQCPGSLVCER